MQIERRPAIRHQILPCLSPHSSSGAHQKLQKGWYEWIMGHHPLSDMRWKIRPAIFILAQQEAFCWIPFDVPRNDWRRILYLVRFHSGLVFPWVSKPLQRKSTISMVSRRLAVDVLNVAAPYSWLSSARNLHWGCSRGPRLSQRILNKH